MKPPPKQHPRRARITSNLPAELRQRLAEYSAAKGVYECDVLANAVAQYLEGTSDLTMLYRRIDALHRSHRRLQRTLELYGEFQKEFVLMFLALTANVADSPKSTVQQKVRGRYQTIIDRVLASAANGKTWVEDLPQDVFSSGGGEADAARRHVHASTGEPPRDHEAPAP